MVNFLCRRITQQPRTETGAGAVVVIRRTYAWNGIRPLHGPPCGGFQEVGQ